MPWPQNLLHLRGGIERFDMGRMMALETARGGGIGEKPCLVGGIENVKRTGAVACFALDIPQLVDVRDC